MTTGVDSEYVYCPIFALPYWSQIGDFVQQVAESSRITGRTTRSLYPAAVAFVLWSWQTRALPLERHRIFTTRSVEAFIHRGMTVYLRGSRATHRSTLYLMVGALNPTEAARARRPIPRSEPTRPYLREEIAALNSWAQAQGTERRRQDATALLALGLGAGLATRELLGVRTADLNVRSDGISVIVWEGRPRTVPVRPDWVGPLALLHEELSLSEWMFRPGRKGINPSQITDFLQRARTELDVRPSRMRTTWLLEHLRVGTSPNELLRIAGLKNLAALDKIASLPPERGTSGSGSRYTNRL